MSEFNRGLSPEFIISWLRKRIEIHCGPMSYTTQSFSSQCGMII
jgi:hypothetical protein